MDQSLNQEEIDSLLNTKAEGNQDQNENNANGAQGYDLANHDKNIYNRIATLGLINEKFSRNIRISLYNFLRRTIDVSIQGMKICKFEDYINTLAVPSSINLVKMNPLKGTSLFVADAKLVFTVVENFFGGEGKVQFKNEATEFTPTEARVIKLLLEMFFKDLKDAWSSVLDLQFDYRGTEVNPAIANVLGLSELIIVSKFRIELEGGGGEFHICIPYSMIEPIRELLTAGLKIEKDVNDEKWLQRIREEILEASIEIYCILTQKKVQLRDVMRFKHGNILDIEIPEEIVLKVNDIPMFKGNFGTFEGKYAVKIVDKVKKSQKR